MLDKLNKLGPDANRAIKAAAESLSHVLAASARAAALADSAPQSPNLAATVKAARDRVPVVTAGGSRKLGRRRKPAYKTLFGAEFGSNNYAQFQRPHAGRNGYWFFPTVERESAAISKAWLGAADDVVRRFGEGG